MRIKLLVMLLVVSVVGLPLFARAAEFRAGEDYLSVSDEVINDNLYVAGGNITVSSRVEGDVFVAGGQINIDGAIAGDLFIGGGNINVAGPVAGDVRIGGGNVRISGDVGGEVMAGAGNFEIAENSEVLGGVYVGAGQLTLAGATGPVMVSGEDVNVKSTAVVNGDLVYTSPREAQVHNDAVITGETKHKVTPVVSAPEHTSSIFAGGVIAWLVTSLLMVILLVLVFPAKSQTLADDWRKSWAKNLLTGFVFLVVTPIAVIVLLISVVGMPIGIGVLLLFPVVLFVGKLVGVLSFGAWVRSMLDKKTGPKADWISAVAGFVLLSVIALVPLLGGLIGFVVFLIGLGALVQFDWALLKSLREQKKI